MTYATYPIDKLPYPSRNSYSAKYGTPYSKQAMDDGRQRNRRQWYTQPQQHTITWRFTWDQLAFFEAFLKYDCVESTEYFFMALYPGAAVQQFRLIKYPDVVFNKDDNTWDVEGTVEVIRAAPVTTLTILPIWPAALPEPEKTSYKVTRPVTSTRSSIEAGQARQRARRTDEVATVTLTWLLDLAQYTVFEAFCNDSLRGGIAPFLGYFANGLGEQLVKCKFLTPPTATENGAAFTVSASVEVGLIPTMTEFVYRGLGKLSLTDSITFTATTAITEGAAAVDTFGYSEAISMSIGKAVKDSVSYGENVSLVYSGKRLPVDTVTYSDKLTFAVSTVLTENVSFRAVGTACWNQYSAATYVEYGYTADCEDFLKEQAASESYAFAEKISLVLAMQRQQIDSTTFSVSGWISTPQYCTVDYCDPAYTMDQLLTF